MGGMPPPSQAGISSIPTPNMQPSFAAGGIVGYAEGEEVGFFDKMGNLARERLSGLETGLDERIARDQGRLKTYEETGVFPEMTDQDYEDAMAVGGLGAIKNVSKATPFIKGTANKAIDYIKNKFKPAAPKKLTKAERAKQSKIDKAKAKADKAAQKKAADLKGTPGGIDRALLNIGSKGLGSIASGAKAIGKGIYNNPIASGIGAIGVGGLGLYNEGQQKAQEAQDLAAQAERDEIRLAQEARALEAQQKTQAALDAQQAAREKRREKEMYLALALGGAKTMAGQSPFALTNIGEGLGTGVGALAAYDQNEMERMAASQAATLAAQQKMQLALMDEENSYRDRVLKLLDTAEYQTFKRQLDEDFNGGDIEQKDYDLKLQDFILSLVGLPPGSRSVDINGQQFTAVE